MSPQEFFANNSLWGATSTGNFFIDFLCRPIFKLWMQSPSTLVSAVAIWFSLIGYLAVKSAFFTDDY